MESPFSSEPDPDRPGWMRWALRDDRRFLDLLGAIHVRADDGGKARVRMQPERRHSNFADRVHGGAILAFIDVALFAGATTCGAEAADNAVTLDCSVQFLSPGQLGRPLDALVELLHETRGLIFVRGVVEQDDGPVAAFSATLRKAPVAK